MTPDRVSPFDRSIMQQCLALARKAEGQTAPNPMVGSIVVQGETIVGTGFHPRAGQPHAEVFALREAGTQAKDATLYVNLEPCNHHGRTPPCTEAILAAEIRKVVVGMVDPDPRVSGEGIAHLRRSGLEVVVGVEEAACQTLNEAFVHRVLYQRPFGILKYAMTLDGKIAATGGHSYWVTGDAARSRVHQLRSTCDAIIVGGNTVRQDNPHLTTHGKTRHTPQRVVMSRYLNLPIAAHLWQVETAPTLVFTGSQADPPTQQYLRDQGVEVIVLEDLHPRTVMAQLSDRGCLSVLWECGGTLAAQAIAAGTVQKIFAFIAPKIIGGASAPSPIGELGFTHMSQALSLERLRWEQIGLDTLIEGYLPCPLHQTTNQMP